MQRDLIKFMTRNEVEIKIGGKNYKVSKEVAGIVSEVGMLAEKWRNESGDDYLTPTVGMLDQWLTWLRARMTLTLQLSRQNEEQMIVSIPGYSPRWIDGSVGLLTLVALGVTNERTRVLVERNEEVRLCST